MTTKKHVVFSIVWRAVNLILVAAVAFSLYGGVREYSVRQYLRGFSDAVMPESAAPEQKAEAILAWMKSGPSRYVAAEPSQLSARDPEITLNYKQLLAVCGTSTNAFLNLARSGGLSVRRLLLLTPERNTKHVVAEVLINGRWIIADPTYRVLLRDAHGQLLTRDELRNPSVFAEAISVIPGYLSDYNYQLFAHVRLERLPFHGFGLRRVLDSALPGWDGAVDWSLLLERKSFLILVLSVGVTLFFLLLRAALAWYADNRLRMPRFHLREHVIRAGKDFFSTPEMKQ